MTGLSRRRFLTLAGAGAIGATGPTGCGWLNRPSQTGADLVSSAALPAPFSVPLPIPPTAALAPDDGSGVDRYRIVAAEAELEILPGLRTPMLTYDGRFPGPTVISRVGRPTVVDHVNRLSVPEVVHLHGGHNPPGSDGFPVDLVLPEGGFDAAGHGGGSIAGGDISEGHREYRYPMNQRAATLWYHDHRMDFTAPAVYRGLAGFHLVHDENEESLGLPTGDRDLPLMVTDRAFDRSGALIYPALDHSMTMTPGVRDEWMDGVLGDVVLVNGAPWPRTEVDAARYRLRILNASNARRYRLRLDPPPPAGSPFVQIGSDGGLLARPVPLEQIQCAPAERFDVVVDFAAYPVGTDVTLINELGSGGTAQVMRFHVARRADDTSRVPEILSQIEDLTAATPAATRTFRFSAGTGMQGHRVWTVNRHVFDPGRVDTTTRLGDVERWRFVSDAHHPIHVHLDPFQVVDRRGSGPGT